jgi:phage terminase Nu1 subunit (DNA packaging protein)
LGKLAKRKEKPEKPRIVGIKQIAEKLNLTPSRIQQLVQEGLPKKLRGKYDVDECTGFYIRYLQALVEKKVIVDAGGEALASERESRLRLLRADAELREIELARERGQLVSIVDVEKEMIEMILTTKARVLAIAARVAPELVGENTRLMIQAKIDRECREALMHLSKKETGS